MRYEKLVRDNIPKILEAKKISYSMHQADDAEFRARLVEKLGEETAEFQHNQNVEEFADVLEVVDALRGLPGFEQVDAVQAKKRDERGGFSKRFIVSGEKE